MQGVPDHPVSASMSEVPTCIRFYDQMHCDHRELAVNGIPFPRLQFQLRYHHRKLAVNLFLAPRFHVVMTGFGPLRSAGVPRIDRRRAHTTDVRRENMKSVSDSRHRRYLTAFGDRMFTVRRWTS